MLRKDIHNLILNLLQGGKKLTAEEIMEEHPDVDDYDAHKIIFREHFKLTDEAKEFAAIFRNMLENYDVPTNWCIREIRDID